MTDYTDYLETLRNEINAKLDKITQLPAGCPERLRDAIRYSLLAPGKRLRPVLTLAGCELFYYDRLNAISSACAVEMIHCYSLIHDDLPVMDNDDLRRGRPTCHKQFDEATAILAGDALLTLAFETVDSRLARHLAIAAGACNLVGGQVDDVLFNGKRPSVRLLERIHHRKTGALIRVSLSLGAVAAGAKAKEQKALDEYGKYFGLAFQITDDLLDVLGSETVAGKRLRKDADGNKLTYPRVFGIDGAKQKAAEAIAKAEEALDFFTPANDNKALNLLRGLVRALANRVV